MNHFANVPRYLNIAGSILTATLLGRLADSGGRKIVLLGNYYFMMNSL